MNNEKLFPQNEEQEHMVQILLAKMQGGNTVEWWNDEKGWWELSDCRILNMMCATYRIKPKETSIPIPDWFWAGIDKELTKAAIDEDLINITFFPEHSSPFVDGAYWVTDKEPYYTTISVNLLGITVAGIDWKNSLTKRPVGL